MLIDKSILPMIGIVVDRPDIGPCIIESIFISYTITVYKQYTSLVNQNNNHYSEMWKTFNLLIDTLEPYFIWEHLTKAFETIVSQQEINTSMTLVPTIEQLCGIINMLLDIFLRENVLEIQSIHLSEMLYYLINIMSNNIEKFTSNQITLCLELLLKIFRNVVTTNKTQQIPKTGSLIDDSHEILDDEETLNDIKRLLLQMVRKVEVELEKLNNQLHDNKQSRLSIKILSESMNYIEKSIELYRNLFHRFIITFIINQNQQLINDKFQNIYSIIKDKTNDNLSVIFNQCRQCNNFQIKLHDNVDEYITAFEDCCKLLIEFNTFPTESSLSKGKYTLD